jgi:hypothetical protein
MRVPQHNRPISVAMREIAASREKEEMARLMREEAMAQQVEQMSDQVPKEYMQMMLQMFKSIGGSHYAQIPADPAEFKRQAIEQAAYAYSSIYMERQPNGSFRMWDFDELVAVAISIVYHPPKTPTMEELAGSDKPRYVIEAPELMYELEGPPAVAFGRYLHFIGVFVALGARVPCETCKGESPGYCPGCDGLGWSVDATKVNIDEVQKV